MEKKKHFKSFKEFLEDKKKEESRQQDKKVDWNDRKTKWLKSVQDLYEIVDKIIISNFKDAGFKITINKEENRITEDYIGSYNINNLIITADRIVISFCPIGTIIIGAYGRVNMILPNETIKLVMPDWGKWKIVKGIGNSMELLDFDEKNILNIFQENL